MTRPPITTGQPVTPWKKHRARELRHEQTPEEALLWERLRGGRIGFRFRRQQIVGGFVVDLYCHVARLAVEVDGGVHDEQVFEDAQRDEALRSWGLHILRVRNEEVNTNLDQLIERITSFCSEHSTSPAVPPRRERRLR